jgi:hypothetical protein
MFKVFRAPLLPFLQLLHAISLKILRLDNLGLEVLSERQKPQLRDSKIEAIHTSLRGGTPLYNHLETPRNVLAMSYHKEV